MKNLKKSVGVLLAAVMLLTYLPYSAAVSAAEIKTEPAAERNYGLPDKIEDGAVLHCWCWDFNTIKANIPHIAEAGFKSIQTSPINAVKIGDNGKMSLKSTNNGNWWYQYQPTDYTIGNYQLGTEDEFKEMCKEAHKYGVKVIVDIVANHCSSDYNSISSHVKNIGGNAFHDRLEITDWSNRRQVTQGKLTGLYDLNTQNPNVQHMIVGYLTEVLADGADGFRFDAAKHIELPDDDSSFAGGFWPTILDNDSEFQYGEVLAGGDRMGAYAQLMNITAESYGTTLRTALNRKTLSVSNIKNYKAYDENLTEIDPSRLVTWVESHDNYCTDDYPSQNVYSSWSLLNNEQIRQGWAVIAAQGDTTPLFFARPKGSTAGPDGSKWGENTIGLDGDGNYYSSEVAAVNHFRNAMAGEGKNIVQVIKNKVNMIERGSKGVVIVNVSDDDADISVSTNLADGEYTDRANGGDFTVSGGVLSGHIEAGAVVVLYDPPEIVVPCVTVSGISNYCINAGEIKGKTGECVTVSFNMPESFETTRIYAALSYDADKLAFKKVESSVGEASCSSNSPGSYSCTLYGKYNSMALSENDTLFTFTFEVIEIGTASVSLNVDNMYVMANGEEVSRVADGVLQDVHIHTAVTDKGYPATCTSEGLSDGSHCSECGKTLAAQTVIPKSEHISETIKGYPATETQEGLSDGVRCSVCGEILVPQQVIPKLKKPVAWTVNDDTLVISGEGELEDYYYQNNIAPYLDSDCIINNLIIEDGITNIGAHAFDETDQTPHLPYLLYISIPGSVESVDGGAFGDCIHLYEVNISEGVKKVGGFGWSDNGIRYTIPESVTEITFLGDDVRVIYGKTGSYAEAYARENLIRFVDNEKKDISECAITLPAEEFTYCGEEIIPEVTITDGEKTLVKGRDYSVLGQGNRDLTYFAELYIWGINDYTGQEIKTFRITKPISSVQVTLPESTFVYDGTEKKPAVSVLDGKKTVTEYSRSYADNINAGTATVTVRGNGLYTGSVTVPFSILQKSIEGATVSFSGSCIYTGSELNPVPTVKLDGKTLSLGSDYSVSYQNNINAGNAEAVITGVGNYTDSAEASFTITPLSISNASVYLSQTEFTYDGGEKKPGVTVVKSGTVLKEDSDYTVSYKNNIEPGTAAVTVTGKGNYKGSVSKSFRISGYGSGFVWGQDNWNFLNSAPAYFPSSVYRDQINNTYLHRLNINLTNSEYQEIFEGTRSRSAWLDNWWRGSCYGMSSLAFLAKKGILPYSDYQTGAGDLNSLGYPKYNFEQLSLITYYQMLQVKGVIQQQYRTVPNKSNRENITNLISLLDEHPAVLVGFQKAGWGGHAILATGYEYGSWTFNGVTYQGCIKICDPNASTDYNTRYNIYFNTSAYNWIIPAYLNMTSTAGARFNYIGANINEINDGGYLYGTNAAKVENYVARIDAAAVSDTRSVSKVEKSGGAYMNQSSQPGEIVEDYSFILGNESDGVAGYNLYDAGASYKISQSNAEELQLMIDYENCVLTGGSAAGKSVIFDKNGYVEVRGESAMYNMSMTFDETYPTDWFTIQVQGYNSDKASLQMVSGGYVLTADNLENVTLKANNREAHAQAAFSANYNSVFIYEIDENTIGLKVDADNNGTYETEITPDAFHIGDANGDGKVNIRDVTAIQRHVSEFSLLTDEQLASADTNGDGKVTIEDATHLQMYLAEYGVLLGKHSYQNN